MMCREFWNRMPELEEEAQQFEHTRHCPSCAALLERQRELTVGLRRLAAASKAVAAPPRVEAHLLAAFRSRPEPIVVKPVSRRPFLLIWTPALAAVIVLALFLVWEGRPKFPGQPSLGATQVAEVEDPIEFESDFVPLPHAEAPSVEESDLVRVELSRATLVALGVPVADGAPGGRVQAEILLGAGGVPQAVRLLE